MQRVRAFSFTSHDIFWKGCPRGRFQPLPLVTQCIKGKGKSVGVEVKKRKREIGLDSSVISKESSFKCGHSEEDRKSVV